MRAALATIAILVPTTAPIEALAAPQADLVVRAVATPRAMTAGHVARVRVVLRNAGPAPSRATSHVALLSRDRTVGPGDRRVALVATRVIPGRRARLVSIVFRVDRALKSGRWHVLACADQGRTVREAREANNCRSSRAVIIRRPASGEPTTPAPDPQLPPAVVVAAPGSPSTSTQPTASRSVVDGIARTRDGTALTYDVTWPAAPTAEPTPLVVLLHGGGWWRGTKRDPYVLSATRQLNDAGFPVAAISYRLACGTWSAPRVVDGFSFTWGSPLCGVHMPTQVQDVVDVVHHLQREAPRMGVDPERIALVGGSAGGHLALLAAATMADPAIRAVVNWSGVPTVGYLADTQADPILRPAFTNAVGCDSLSCPAQWLDGDPLARLRRAGSRVPVLSTGGLDEQQVPFEVLRAFHADLDVMGASNLLLGVPGACHGASCLELEVVGSDRTVLQATGDFLRSVPGFMKPRA